MTGRPRPQPPPALLDWRNPAHWSWNPKPCRYCGADTNLRDSKRKPAHKTCAETAITQQAADMAGAYRLDNH